MKRLLAAFAVMAIGIGVTAAPPPGGHAKPIGPRIHQPAPPRAPTSPHHKGGTWGRGGRNFLPGFLGACTGTLVADAVYHSTPYVRTTYAPEYRVEYAPSYGHYETRVVQIWIPGVYEDRVDALGRITRVWIPGHYESRSERVWVP